ncbi:MAG TPA: inositol monophosphatase family protein [Acidimicrobiales bacterium]|jgi:myo-inositol-1(or 4)-monophosphatase
MSLPGPSAETAPADPQDLLKLATRVAEQAAALLLERAGRHRTSVGTKSTGTDMVTEMDRASEQLIVGELLAARPADGILAEEGSARDGTSGLRWVIDPLDGTTNYLYGHPGWGVSIAAETSPGTVVAGVVIDAVHGDVFTAARGHGARRNGEPIRRSDQADLSRTLVATGFGYHPDRRRAQAELLVELLPQIRDIRRMGAAAVDLCSVACGRVDAYYEYGLSWWDCAAGSLVAAEAGAVVASLDDRPLDQSGSVVAAAPGIADPLRAQLRALGAHRVP